MYVLKLSTNNELCMFYDVLVKMKKLTIFIMAVNRHLHLKQPPERLLQTILNSIETYRPTYLEYICQRDSTKLRILPQETFKQLCYTRNSAFFIFHIGNLYYAFGLMSVALYSWGTLVNFAEGSPTWQSSHWSETGGFAHLAVDGIDDPSWYGLSCASPADFQVTVPPVWAVDIGHTVNIYHVEVLNRDVLSGKLLFFKAGTKWPQFCKRHVQVHLIEWKSENFELIGFLGVD